MFGNGMTDKEFHQSLNNTIDDYIQHRNHLDEVDTIKDAHHTEVMKLIDHLNEVKREYRKLGEAYDGVLAQKRECIEIMRDHLHEMSIDKDEINSRLEKAWELAVKQSSES